MIRLRRLDLEFFGRFSGKSYDFGPRPTDAPDFHIIHGSNEAGKTTTMEGFLRLLYGFPLREPYAFQHDRKTLRISGLLDLGQSELSLTRLPSRHGNLLDGQGNALPEQTLAAHLGGLGQDDYRNLLCLDDETIESGGEEIASAKGDIGRLLFSAAAGISDLSEVLASVRTRADALYKKRSSKTKMAELKAELKTIDQCIRETDVSATAYRALRQARDRAAREEAEGKAAREAHTRDYARAKARRDALPLLAQIERLDQRINAYPDYPDRLDFDPEDLVAMLADQSKAEADIHRLKDEITALSAKQDGIERHPGTLALGTALTDIDDLRSRYITADKDLSKRRTSLQDVLDDMAAEARDLGAAQGIDPAALVLAQDDLVRLEAVRDAKRTEARAVETARDEVTKLAERTADGTSLQACTDAADGPDIGAILERFSADTLATRHAGAQQALDEAQRQADAARDALLLKGQAFTALPVCPLTAQEAADLAEQHKSLCADQNRNSEEIETLKAEAADNAAKIASLSGKNALIDDDAAQALLTERNTLWRRHYKTLNTATAEAFENAMRRVDDSAQTRLSHAEELGQLRHLQEDAARTQRRLKQAEVKQAQLKAQRDTLETQLAEAAQSSGIPAPLSPPAFATWTTRLELAQDAAQRLDRTIAQHAATFDRAAQLTQKLAPLLDLAARDFDSLLAAARKRAEKIRKQRESARAAQAQLAQLEAELARRQAQLQSNESALQEASETWVQTISKCFGDAINRRSLEGALTPLHNLRELDSRRTSLTRQIDAMEADQRAFEKAVAQIAGETAQADPLKSFKALKEQTDAADAAEALYEQTKTAIADREAELTKAQQLLTSVAAKWHEIANIFPVNAATTTLPELRETVGLAQSIIADKAKRADLLAELCLKLNVTDLSNARLALDDTTTQEIDARLMQLDSDGTAIEDRYREAIAQRSAAERDLRTVTGDADIAALTERKATIELEMQDTALAYLELHLGHELAEEAIRRYRDTHRSSMMQATETAFAELTNGAYTRLITQPDGSTETLIALDPAGRSKQAQDMSKGTRFQLYLALRAAAYEQLAQQGTVLPFFCDDIFETFDEDRTRAACHLMARIGRTGQAIYLTHHSHVVDIARQVCGDRLRVHEI